MSNRSRIDWLRVVVWTALVFGACLLANALAWLVQRIIMLAWPIVSANPRAVLAVLAVAICGAWALSRGRQ